MLNRSVILLLIFAAAAAAQQPSKILKTAEKALGGTKVLQSRNSIASHGRISRLSDGAAGEFEMETGRPNLFHVRYDIAGVEVELGYNGRSAWRRDSRSGLQTLTGADSLALQSRAAFRNLLWLNAKSDKTRIAAQGRTTIDSQTADIIVFTNPKGIAIKVYFDVQTGLPIMEEISGETWEFNDYRPVNGSKIPFAMSMATDGERYEIKLDDAAVNRTIAPTLFDFPKTADEPMPDLKKLLADLQSNQERIENLLDSYSYTRKVTTREVEKDGSLHDTETDTHQLSFYKGYRIERRIEKNGKPLSDSEQADEDRAVAKRTEEIEKRIAKAEKNDSKEEDTKQRSVSIAELLRSSQLKNPRRELLRGRKVIVFDFEPDPSFDFKNAKSMLKFFGKTAGVIWVDEEDKQAVRIEAYLADTFSVGGGLLIKLNKGASFVAEQERVNDEIWLPSMMEINLTAKILMLKGIDVNQVVRSYDYRKFKTEVKDAQINQVQKP
jgi:hypothetical protein